MSEHFRGRLEVFGLADLLQWMELNRRSGRLTLTRATTAARSTGESGEIVYVSGSLPRHRLGVHLLRSGALPAATLYELLARNMTTQENLTRLILDMDHDTLDGLSLRVEELARKLLFEIFEWREANFEYDPSYRVQPILRIGLTLRGQALAFQGVKQLDDTHRLSRKERRETWRRPTPGCSPSRPTASRSTSGKRPSAWGPRSIRSRRAARGALPRVRPSPSRAAHPQLPDAAGAQRHGAPAPGAAQASAAPRPQRDRADRRARSST